MRTTALQAILRLCGSDMRASCRRRCWLLPAKSGAACSKGTEAEAVSTAAAPLPPRGEEDEALLPPGEMRKALIPEGGAPPVPCPSGECLPENTTSPPSAYCEPRGCPMAEEGGAVRPGGPGLRRRRRELSSLRLAAFRWKLAFHSGLMGSVEWDLCCCCCLGVRRPVDFGVLPP